MSIETNLTDGSFGIVKCHSSLNNRTQHARPLCTNLLPALGHLVERGLELYGINTLQRLCDHKVGDRMHGETSKAADKVYAPQQ